MLVVVVVRSFPGEKVDTFLFPGSYPTEPTPVLMAESNFPVVKVPDSRLPNVIPSNHNLQTFVSEL